VKAYVLDTETSQLGNPEVIELAYGEVDLTTREIAGDGIFCTRFKPKGKLSCGAMAVHHIIPSDLDGCPDSSGAKIPGDCSYLIGHNIDFDWKVLGSPSHIKRIDTMAMARAYWPGVEGHTLGACIYRISEFEQARTLLQSAHSAKTDIELALHLLDHFILEYIGQPDSWEHLWQVSEECRVPKVWAFGKHKGKQIGEADKGYLNWVIKQPDMDEYVKVAARSALRDK